MERLPVIWLVDPSRERRGRLRRALRAGFDHQVVELEVERLGWATLPPSPADAVLLAAALPGGDGCELGRRLVAEKRANAFGVIAPRAAGDAAQRAWEAGAAVVIPWPALDTELVARLAELTAAGTGADPVALAAHRLASAREELSACVRLLAHDLRGPTSAILSAATFAETNPSVEDQAFFVATCREAGERLRQMIDNIELCANGGDAAAGLGDEPIDLHASLTALVSEQRASLRLREVQVAMRVAEERAVLVGDRALAHTLCANLLLNAIESTPPGGGVVVCTRVVGGAIELEVSDSGPRLTPEQAALLGDELAQPLLKRQSARVGRGMSLVAASLAAAALGAEIEYRPREPRGLSVLVRWASTA